jgi:hypothetical protein
METEVEAKGNDFTIGKTRLLFKIAAESGFYQLYPFDVSADEQKFIINSRPEQSGKEINGHRQLADRPEEISRDSLHIAFRPFLETAVPWNGVVNLSSLHGTAFWLLLAYAFIRSIDPCPRDDVTGTSRGDPISHRDTRT